MTFALADRVQETTTTTGTGTLTLGGAVYAYQSFATALASGSTCDYSILDPATGAWEVGVGTFTAPSTLSRDSVLSSSNGNALVNFGAGTKYVYVVASASYLAGLDNTTAVVLAPTTSTRNVIQGTGDIKGLVVKATAAQSAVNIAEVQDSSGNPYLSVGPTGHLLVGPVDAAFIANYAIRALVTSALDDNEYDGVNGISIFTGSSSVNASGYVGVTGKGRTTGSGTIANLTGVSGQAQAKDTTTVTTARAVWAVQPTKDAGATITTAVGLEVSAITQGGTNYAIRTSSGIVQLGGNLNLATGIIYPSSDSTTALRLMKADAATAVLTVDTTGSKVTVPKLILSAKFIYPSADSTTGIQFTQADGATVIATIDTTNKWLGIGTTPTTPLTVAGEIRNSSAADGSPFTQARLTVYRDASNFGYIGYGSDTTVRFVIAKTGGGTKLSFGTSSAVDNTGAYTEIASLSVAGLITVAGISSGATGINSSTEIRHTGAASGTPFTQTRVTVYRDASHFAYFAYGSDLAMRLVFDKTGSTGKLSIGTSSAVDNTGTYVELFTISVNGKAQIKSGLAATIPAALGGAIFDHFTDAGNTTTAETDLYTDTLPASALGTNGDKIVAEYEGIYVTSATASRQLRVYFGGTLIFDSTALVSAVIDQWNIRVRIIRVSASVVRCAVTFTDHNTTITSSFSTTVYTEVTGLTLANTQILKITGTAAGTGAATNDLVAKLGTIDWRSAA